MTQVKPFVRCIDFWTGQIPQNKLDAYRQLIEEGQIQLVSHVVYDEITGSTAIEYTAIAPHEWILEQLKQRCMGGIE